MGIKRKGRIRHFRVREKTKSKDIRYMIKKQKMRYAGHISRKTNNRWESKNLNWVREGGADLAGNG